jgi:hypothetical protein
VEEKQLAILAILLDNIAHISRLVTFSNGPTFSKEVNIFRVGSNEVVPIARTFEPKELLELDLMDGAYKRLPSIKNCLLFNISCFMSICGVQVLKYFIHNKISFLNPSSFEVAVFDSLNVSHKQSFKVSSYNYELGYSLVVLVQSLPQYNYNDLCHLLSIVVIGNKMNVLRNNQCTQLQRLHNLLKHFLFVGLACLM